MFYPSEVFSGDFNQFLEGSRRISELPSIMGLSGDDIFIVVNEGETRKITFAQLTAFIPGDLTSGGGSNTVLSVLSGNWQNTYATVYALSGNWNSSSNTLKSLSANWQNTYGTVQGLSGNWQNTYGTVQGLSSNWQNTYGTVQGLSSDWQSTHATVCALSSNWQNTFGTVQGLSGNWQSTYATVCALSANWVPYNYLHQNFLPLSGGSVTGSLSVVGSTFLSGGLTVKGDISASENVYGKNISNLTSNTTFTENLTVSLPLNKTFGRYSNGDVIAAAGKNVADVIRMSLVEPITPDATLTSSTTILFNQTNISNVLTFSHWISSLNATIASGVFETKRNNETTWSLLSTSNASSGVLAHTLTNTPFNTNAFNYRYTVTDTVGAFRVVTRDISVGAYTQPTISLSVSGSVTSPETNSSREKGNVSSIISGTINRQSAFVTLINYQLQYRVNTGSWVNVGSVVPVTDGATAAIVSTLHSPTGDVGADSLSYRVLITDSYNTTTAAATQTVNFNYLIFYGPTASTPTNSAQVRTLPTKSFTNVLTNPFNLVTGETLKIFVVALPTAVAAHDTITQVLDLDALNSPVTTNYINTPISVLDAGGISSTYNVYAMTNAIPYSPPPTGGHRHQVTRA